MWTNLALHPHKTMWLVLGYTLEEGSEQGMDVDPRLVRLLAL